jgi:dihydroorotate dehydrogenase
LYPLIRSLLFALDAEHSHDLTLGLLRAPGAALALRHLYGERVPALPVDVMGLRLPNPVGLAAGLDKNASAVPALTAMGFGFLELGTVTPRPQAGNPRPRLFRLTGEDAIINRMGFNSAGVDRFLGHLENTPRSGIIGINLGKNKDTPAEEAINDYVVGLRAVYAHADYVTVNVSSPNTPGLRALQDEEALSALLTALKAEQATLAARHGRYVPIALKIAPDLTDEDIDSIARLLLDIGLDGVIATNTTITRPGLNAEPLARETGGLSGAPLRSLSTHVIRRLHATLAGRLPIIGVGGVFSADHAWEKLVAGADLVQIYTGLIYRGPEIIRAIVAGLADKVRARGAPTLAEAVAGARRAK